MRIRRRCRGAIWALLIIAGACPACRSSASSSALFGLGHSPHETADNLAVRSATDSEADSPAGRAMPIPTVFDLAFDVARVEFPVGELHPSRKTWNHVDMMRVDAPLAASLARNGIRVGVGTPAAWPAIKAIIESGGGVVRRDQLSVARGQPLALDLGPVPEGTSIFAYDKSGRLAGRTFDAGHYVTHIDYLYQADPVDALDVQIGLEIRNDHGVMTWERQGAIIRQVPSIDHFGFEGAKILATLSRDEFLVLGPDADQSGAYLVGSRFFVRERDGEFYETMLFLTPKVMATSVPTVTRNDG